ncbi:MAG TPA: zinc-binding dehydrogenase [Ignavibacteriaceae bacterium]|nr:zinc-binding dehydrogenase [Ignavibacteriaceae bacterium]
MERLAYRINKAGSINNLKLVKEDLPNPADEEVTIQVKAIGLNFADIFAIQGLYSATPKESFVPGLEYSGIIFKNGKGVTKFEVGEKVMGAIRFGAYTNYLNINKNYIQRLPKDWSFEDGAAFTVQSLTAYYSLIELADIKNNSTVLIHSAAGGVGIYANRIAKKFNAYTIGTVGSDNKTALLKKEGYDQVIVRDDNFAKNLTESLKGKNLDIVLECIGGKIFSESFKQLSAGGRIIVYGAAQYSTGSSRPNYLKVIQKYLTRPKIDPLSLSDKNKSIMGFNLIYLWDKIELMQNILEDLLKMNLPKPLIGEVYQFTDLLAAVKKFQSGETVGKVIVKV